MPVNPYTTSNNPYAAKPAAQAPVASPPPPPAATSTNPYARQDTLTRSAANTTAKPAPVATSSNPYGTPTTATNARTAASPYQQPASPYGTPTTATNARTAASPYQPKPAAPAPTTTSTNPYAAKPAQPAPAPAAPATTSTNPYGPKPAPTTTTTTTTTSPYAPKPSVPNAPVAPKPPAPQPQAQAVPFWPFATPVVPFAYRDQFTLPHNTAPSEIADAFKAATNRVPVLLGRSGLPTDQIEQVRLDLARQAVSQLVNANGTIVDKVHALNDIGDVGVLTCAQKLTVQDELVRREIERIRHAQDSFDEKHARLDHMEPFMTPTAQRAALGLLVDDEARRIAGGHDSATAREGRLAKLRDKVGMSSYEFESYKALISLKH